MTEQERLDRNSRAREYRKKNAVRLREYWKALYLKNRDQILRTQNEKRSNNREEVRANDRRLYRLNRKSICQRKLAAHHKNRGKRLVQMKSWRDKNLVLRRKYRREYNLRYRTTDKYRFENALRQRIFRAIKLRTKGTTKKCASTESLLGCSIKDLRIYLESRFEVGMSWLNFGKVWHVDHIMPCAIFDLSRNNHQKRCFHFSNLRPCFAIENIKKGKKVLSDQFLLI